MNILNFSDIVKVVSRSVCERTDRKAICKDFKCQFSMLPPDEVYIESLYLYAKSIDLLNLFKVYLNFCNLILTFKKFETYRHCQNVELAPTSQTLRSELWFNNIP